MPKQYEPPLRLVSPNIRGQHVRDAQWLMAGHNRFKGLATMKDAQIDGVYGLTTAQATKRTKYWLGYPLTACDMVFGQKLYEYLRPNKWRPLPEEYRDRRDQRLKAAARTPGKKALEFAIGEIGTRESPFGSNRTKYGAWYGFNGVPWCAIFESYCFAQTGRPQHRYAACILIVQDARAQRNGLRIVYSPIPGDLAIFNVHGDPYAHTAFFEKWITVGDEFYDVGGNTGPSNISNGGAVMRQRRRKSMVTAFVRVG
jgi:hypothetical protein